MKILFFIGFFFLIYNLVDTTVLSKFVTFKKVALSIMVCSLSIIVQYFFFSARFYLCTRLLDKSFSFINSLKSTFLGGLCSHTPFSFIGGDAARVTFCMSKRLPLSDSIKAVYIDRMFGFIALILLTFFFLPITLQETLNIAHHTYYIMLALFIIFGFMVFFFLNKIIDSPHFQKKPLHKILEILSASRAIRQHKKSSVILLLSIFTTLNFPLSFWLIALICEIEITLIELILTVPLIMLTSMLPFFFSGWGIREFTSISILSLFDVGPEAATSISMIYGFSILIGCLPGIPILLSLRSKTH